MEHMDKELTVPKRVLIFSSAVNSQNTPKSLKFIRPVDPIGLKIWDILKKGLYWVSVIRARTKD